MSETGISYAWSVDPQLSGVDDGIKKLKSAEDALKGLDKSTKGVDSQIKGFKDTLGGIKRPGDFSKLKDDLHGIAGGAHEAKEGFRGVGEAVEHAHSRLTGFLEFAGIMLAIDLVKDLTEHIVELGAEIVNAAAKEERTSKVFKLNFGVEGGEEALKYAEKFSKGSEFTEDQSKEFLAPLLNAGVPLKEMDKYMAAAGDVASGFTNKLDGMSRAVEAFRRMELSGKLDGRSLRSLNLGVPQMKDLAEFKGKTDKELKAILEKGSLTKSQVFKMIAGSDNLLGDKSVDMSETMSAKIDKLKALPDRLYQSFMNSPAFDGLKEKLDHVLEKFDPDAPGGQAIIKGIGAIGEALLHVLDGVDLESVLKSVLGVINALPEAIHAVGSAFGAISKNWEYIKDVGQFLTNPLGAVKDQVFKPVFQALTGSAGEEAKNVGVDITTGLYTGIDYGAPRAVNAAADLGHDTAAGTKDALKIKSPSKVFEQIGMNIGAGLASGLGKSQSGIDDVMRGAFAIPASSATGQAMASGGGIQVEINVTVDGHAGASGRDLGQQIAETIRPIVASELADAVERMNGAGGIA